MSEMLTGPKKIVDGLTKVFRGLTQMCEGMAEQIELLESTSEEAEDEDKLLPPAKLPAVDTAPRVQDIPSWHPLRLNVPSANLLRPSRKRSRPAHRPGLDGISPVGWRPSRKNPARAFRWSSIPKTDISCRICWKTVMRSVAVGV